MSLQWALFGAPAPKPALIVVVVVVARKGSGNFYALTVLFVGQTVGKLASQWAGLQTRARTLVPIFLRIKSTKFDNIY